jgi:hypothetical protein
MQSRKTVTILVAICLALLSAVSRSFAADNPFDTGNSSPAPSAVDPYDWYQIGEFMDASAYNRFNQAVADHLENTYNGLKDLLVKTHCSDQTLNALKQVVALLKSLPWSKPWEEWPDDAKDKWSKSTILENFYRAVWSDARKAPESYFFCSLGSDALELSWAIPYYYENRSIDRVKSILKSAVNDIVSVANSKNYKGVLDGLSPDVAHAIEVIVALKTKVNGDDPLTAEELTDADIDNAIQSGQAIRTLAKKHKLLK